MTETFRAAAKNTDRELYREDTGDSAGSYYESSVHVTADGRIAMNVGGTVLTRSIREWHESSSVADEAARRLWWASEVEEALTAGQDPDQRWQQVQHPEVVPVALAYWRSVLDRFMAAEERAS